MLLNFGFGTATAGNTIVNSCFTFGNDGVITWYGYRSASFGTVSPDNINGLHHYSFEHQVDGTMRAQFGAAGNEQIPGIDQMIATTSDKTQYTMLVWHSVNLAYEATDLDMATYLIAKADECINLSELPDTFIEYDMSVSTN